MGSEVSRKVARILVLIDREGMPPLPASDWLVMLQQIQSAIASRIQAAKEDARVG